MRRAGAGEAQARAEQTATAEILKIIASSPSSVQPVFDGIVRSAMRIVGGQSCGVTRVVGDRLHLVSLSSTNPSADELVRSAYPMVLAQPLPMTEVARGGQTFLVEDTETDSRFGEMGRRVARARGFRSIAYVPMRRQQSVMGVIHVACADPRAITADHIKLLESFADQAVIAIENVRLFNETKEALERQTATAEILKVISESPTDVQPVFDAIAKSAARLIGVGARAGIAMREGDLVDLKAIATTDDLDAGRAQQMFEAMKTQYPRPYDPERHLGSMVMESRVPLEVEDTEAPGALELVREIARSGGYRSIAIVPLLREGVGIGMIAVSFEQPGVRLNDNQRVLLQTFADQAVIAIENVRLFNETKESLAHQTAAADVLQVIGNSVADTQPVFERILDCCESLMRNDNIFIDALGADGTLQLRAHRGAHPDLVRQAYPVAPPPLTPGYLEWNVASYPDCWHGEGVPQRLRDASVRSGINSSLIEAAMLSQGRLIGTITATRMHRRGYTAKEERLLKTFADQAVIAIENTRLFNETKQALERQTATAEVLKSIAGSPDDVQPVFDAIAANAVRLIQGRSAVVLRAVDDMLHLAALTGTSPDGDAALRKSFPIRIVGQAPAGRAVATGRPAVSTDVETDPVFSPEFRQAVRARGTRSIVAVPMLREGSAIGAIVVTRDIPGEFSDHQVRLLETFADQAVIAIENVRLFKDLEGRNREVTIALERQTATAEILRVIASSPDDVQPVFQSMLASVQRLLKVNGATVSRIKDDTLYISAWSGDERAPEQPVRIEAEPNLVQMIGERRPVIVDDVERHPGTTPVLRELAHTMDFRSIAHVPLLHAGAVIGMIAVHRREPGGFTNREVGLLQSFADQAVIAIQNVRLFNETKEALERQTATADILKVIASSPNDTQPVFDIIAERAVKLCGGTDGVVLRFDGGVVELAAQHNQNPEGTEAIRRAFPCDLNRNSAGVRAIRTSQTVELADVTKVPGYYLSAAAEAGQVRRMLAVPLLREGRAIGAVAVAHSEPGYFSSEQVGLLKTFADQAVIAIENVRLFKELQSRTDALTKSVGQLTALGEVSQALSSTLDLEKVLATIVSRAVQLTGLDGGAIFEYDEAQGIFLLRGGENLREEVIELNRTEPIRMGAGVIGGAALARKPVQVPDLREADARARGRDVLLGIGFRALLAVPLVREDHVLGALAVVRNTPGAFPPEVIALLETFATQSAIAIQNAHLFREIEDKSRQLEVASQHKSQFLASMSHELRTPLNAILGFNEMMLDGLCGEAPEGFTDPLNEVQKSGKHLLRLINNVLDLAKIEAGRMELVLGDYSVQDLVEGVRSTLRSLAAEKGLEFVVTVREDLPLAHGDAGRLTQCLINLAGNSLKFTKQGKVEVSVSQRDGLLAFRVSDTGIGIAPDKIGGLFTEFKQTDATIASEYGGSGLGLSIVKKFIEMHGGRIWAESELGKGSTFIFEIPVRAGAKAA